MSLRAHSYLGHGGDDDIGSVSQPIWSAEWAVQEW